MAATRERGRCCAADLCGYPQLELNPQHRCHNCNNIVHTVCGKYLVPGSDDIVCNLCLPEVLSGHSTDGLLGVAGVNEEEDANDAGDDTSYADNGAFNHAHALYDECSDDERKEAPVLDVDHMEEDAVLDEHNQEEDAEDNEDENEEDAALDRLGAACETGGGLSSHQNWSAAKQRFERFIKWLLLKKLRGQAAEDAANRIFKNSTDRKFLWENFVPRNITLRDLDIYARWLHSDATTKKGTRQIAYKTAESDMTALLRQLRHSTFYEPEKRFTESDLRLIRGGMRKLFQRRAE